MTKIKRVVHQNINNCTVKGCDGKCHWIIMKDDHRSIFQGPFPTKESARGTVEFHNLSGYHLEHRFNSTNND